MPLVFLISLALLWSGVGFLLLLERDRVMEQAERDVANLALAFEEQSYWVLSSVDNLLHTAKAEYEGDPGGFDIPVFLREHALPAGFSVQMSIVGADGYLLMSSLGMGPDARITNYLDRPHIIVHAHQDTGRIFIGAPIVGRLSGKWSLPISIRVNDGQGRFAGVITLAADPFYLSGYYRRLDLGAEGAVSILGTDGILRARSTPSASPDGPAGLGRTLNSMPVARLTEQAPAAVLEQVSDLDGIERVTAMRRIRSYPLVATVGRGVDEVLRPWWSLVWRAVGAAGLASLGLTGLFWMLCREAQQRLRQDRDIAEANRLLRLAEQVAMVGHWRLEIASRRLTWSDEVYRIHGLSKDLFQPTLEKALTAYHPDDRGRVRELVASAMQTGSSYEIALRVVRPDGEIRHVVTRGVVEFGSGDRPMALFGALIDVTDRTHQEEALLAARREAEAAARAKTDFLATVSHELRTPLNAVIGFADLLLTADLPEAERRRYIRLQAEAGRTLLTVINDVLDFSKIDAGHLALEEVATDTVGVLLTCAELVRPMAQEKGLNLQVDLAPDLPPWLLLDPTRVRQVLLNLLNNATKFTQAGSVSLTAGVLHDPIGGDRLRFTVADTGIGIPQDRQAHLFEPFHQADASTARRYGGTGLGLAICRRLIGLMGGQIGFSSEVGRGSLFWVEIPLRPTEPPAHAPMLPTPGAGEATAPGRPLHVLVAEDLPVNQILVRAILERAGHRVDIAVDGQAALDAVQRQSFDLILMDVQMPGMDGLEATRAIRALPSAVGRIPIVALTANALASEVERCRKAGMNDHIAKPIEAEHLLVTLSRWSQRIHSVTGEPGDGGDGADVKPGGPPRLAVLSADLQAQLETLMGRGALLPMMQELISTLRTRLTVALDPATPLDVVRTHSHATVSLAGNFGLMELSATARTLEQAIDNGEDRAAVTLLLDGLAPVAERALSALTARIEELSAPLPAGS
ncbi:ATP-binding protein [Niveispirillum fermenti]|uniref:ATP-binding protein n=1 Tax=Niveispirillum fermenti TaxID=1233113 RepID=UPI00404391AC